MENDLKCSLSGKTLRELTCETAEKVTPSRRPDTTAFVRVIDRVLHAMGLEVIGDLYVRDISSLPDGVHIAVHDLGIGREHDHVFVIPNTIIDAADPLFEAEKWRLERRVQESQQGMERARRNIQDWRCSFERHEAELAQTQEALQALIAAGKASITFEDPLEGSPT